MLHNREIGGKQRRSQPRLSLMGLVLSTILLSSGVFALDNDLSDSGRFLRLSRTIFRGRVVSSTTFLNSHTGDILTRFLFQVDETLKGPQSGQIEITEYGGTIGDLTMVVPHGAKYRPGTAYLVFAWRDELRRERTLGGDRGALLLILDETGNAAVRLPPNHPLKSLLPNESGRLVDFRSLSRAIVKADEASSSNEK